MASPASLSSMTPPATATPRELPRARMLASGVMASVVLHALLVSVLVRYQPEPASAAASSTQGVTLVLAPWESTPTPTQPDLKSTPPALPEPRDVAMQPPALEDAPPPEPAKEPEVALGVDDGAEPTENMLGAAVARENLAPKASVDQPAFALDPSAPGTAQQAPPLPPAEEPAEQQQAIKQARVEQAASPSQTPVEAQAAQEARPAQPRAEASTPPPNTDAFAPPSTPPTIAQPPTPRTPAQPAEAPTPASTPQAELAAQAAVDQMPTPAAPRVAGGDSRLPGARSDSESEAFSTAGSLEFRPGTPLAGKGIRIRTVLPRFSITTRLMAVPNNPVIVVRFSRTGKVLSASFEDDKGTGYEDVDVPLLAAVHRWTATGEQLQRIPQGDPKAGLTFKIKYILRE